MGKGSAKTEVTEYYMSIHQGICGGGELDAIMEIQIGEKIAWSGEVTQETAIQVNAPELFGGVKKEGGAIGIAYYLPGGENQVMPTALAARFGLTSQTCPGFRGFPSIFFVGQDNYGSVALPGDTGGGSAGDGGTVTGGGGGGGVSGGGGGLCVVSGSWLADGTLSDDATLDTVLLVLDYETMNSVERRACIRRVRKGRLQPCVGIITESQIHLGVSTATPMTMRDGSTPNVLACLGREVPVFDGNGFRWEKIVDLVDLGNRDVVHIDANDATYAAGREKGRYILTHNKTTAPAEER